MPLSVVRSFINRRFDPAGRFGLRITLFAIAVLVVGIPFGFLLEQVVHNGPLVRADTSAARYLHDWVRHYAALVTVLKVVSFLGTPLWFYVICSVAAYFLWRHGRKRLIAFLVATAITGGIIDTIVKIVVNRNRPSLEDPIATAHGQSFPSGHSMSSFIVYGALLLIFLPVLRHKTAWIVAGSVLVAAIGFSRLALGVHFISDVLGGYVLGAAWLTASTAAFSIWRVERGRKPVEPLRGVEPEAKRDLSRAP
jgi:membrane-associated phospholipid phosphatase